MSLPVFASLLPGAEPLSQPAAAFPITFCLTSGRERQCRPPQTAACGYELTSFPSGSCSCLARVSHGKLTAATASQARPPSPCPAPPSGGQHVAGVGTWREGGSEQGSRHSPVMWPGGHGTLLHPVRSSGAACPWGALQRGLAWH